MPELPEVETVVRGLEPCVGMVLLGLDIFDAKVWCDSTLPPSALHGRTLLSMSRRGKYILFRFSGGVSLIQHLRMTGKMLDPASTAIPPHVRAHLGERSGKGLQLRFLLRFENKQIVFYDTRRFGTAGATADEAEFFLSKHIAPDPLATPEEALAHFLLRLRESRKPVKSALLDQSIVAGVGNIYADEALHGVGLHPLLPADRVPAPKQLWAEIERLLLRSIRLGGTTILDYVNAEGKKGAFAKLLRVYAREGEDCQRCGKAIQRIQLGGRSTHFCLYCQPLRAISETKLSKKARGPKKKKKKKIPKR